MKKIKVGIVGAAGYTGGELIRILLYHPGAEIIFAHSKSNAGNPFHTVHKDLLGETDQEFTAVFDDTDIEVLFLCAGHGQSKLFFEENKVRDNLKIIDLSQDFRILEEGQFREFTYGLVEAEREYICQAKSVANPGCFATCIQLGLLPLALKGLLNSEIHISATTGSTGAGQSMSLTSHFSWRNNNLSIYKPFEHQHLRETKQSLKRWQSGFDQTINFIPIRGNFTRGILASIYFDLDIELEELQGIFNEYYQDSPFVVISPTNIDLKQVVNTNKCMLHLEKHGNKVLIISIIDNLVKGASGQAVQNMNLMFGQDETTGLNMKSIAF